MPGAAKKAAKTAAQRAAETANEPLAVEKTSVDQPVETESDAPVAAPAPELERTTTVADDGDEAEADTFEPTQVSDDAPTPYTTYEPVAGSDGPRSQTELDALG